MLHRQESSTAPSAHNRLFMARLAITSPATTGPLNTMLPLARNLIKRGHDVVVLGIMDIEARVRAAGVKFYPIGVSRFPLGENERLLGNLGRLSGLSAMKFTIDRMACWAETMMNEAPAALSELKVEAVIANQGSVESGTVADAARIPFFNVCSAIPLNFERKIPPVFTGWNYSQNWVSQLRNQICYFLQAKMAEPITHKVVAYRKANGLTPYKHPNDVFSPLLQISQFTKSYEFPRECLPQWFHFTGPFHSSEGREPVDFPWEKIDSSLPLIYASLGTLQNRQSQVLEKIARATSALPVQAVVSTGGAPVDFDYPKNVIVVRYAPQIEILDKASIMISHGGANSVMESLARGVPLLIVPIANDQSGNGARVRRCDAGRVVTLRKLSVKRLSEDIQQLLVNPKYRENAERLKKEIQQSGGVSKACSLIEESLRTGRPVLHK